MGMPSTARRAREEALNRHRREVRHWQRVSCMTLIVFIIMGSVAMYLALSEDWRTDKPMPMQRLTVVTEGFMDRDGNWRSFDSGEKISVQQWKP